MAEEVTLHSSKRGVSRSPYSKQEQLQIIAKNIAEGLPNSAREEAIFLGVTERQVNKLRALVRSGEAGVYVMPPPREARDQAPRIRKMRQRTVDGFGLFYEEYSGLYYPNHVKLWVEEYLANDRLLLNVPPRHAKSKFFSVWIPMWEICQDRDIQILLLTQTEKLAKKWALEVAWHLQHNIKMISDWGTFMPDDPGTPWRPMQGELMVVGRRREVKMGDLTLQIKGKGMQIIGAEADRIIVDDLVDPKRMNSPTYVDELSEFYHGEVFTRRSPKAKICVIGQRVHDLDLYGELARARYTRVEGQPPIYKHVNFPAILDWDKELVLWPEEWPFEALMESYEGMRRKGSTALFETMYQQNPLPPDATLIRPEWIEGDADHPGCWDSNRIMGMNVDLEEGWKQMRIISVDPSPTKFTGFVVADIAIPPPQTGVPTGQRPFYCVILEILRGSWDLRETVSQVKRAVTTYHPDHLIFEINAAQRWFFQDLEFMKLRADWNLSVIPHTTGIKKTDADYGIQSLAGDFEKGWVRLPGGDKSAREQSSLLLEEAYAYPSPLTSTDILMALWFIKFNHARLSPRLSGEAMQQSWTDWAVPPRVEAGWDFLGNF